jgi:NAD(P)-dependent dehydrogenase (short-subunit alcohol dehydrogenase family)
MADRPLALVVGATRGIGLGVVREFLSRGWDAVATARHPPEASRLADLANTHPGRVDIVRLDMNDPAQIDGFTEALGARTLDVALINAGVYGPGHQSASVVTPEEIGALMFTNAIAPIRLARLLLSYIRKDTGVLAFTSSAMGSVTLNQGGAELYRVSKAALNLLTRGLQSEAGGRKLTLLTLHPGWVRTDMGGPNAAVSVKDSARGLLDVITREKGAHRHAFIDYTGAEVPW